MAGELLAASSSAWAVCAVACGDVAELCCCKLEAAAGSGAATVASELWGLVQGAARGESCAQEPTDCDDITAVHAVDSDDGEAGSEADWQGDVSAGASRGGGDDVAHDADSDFNESDAGHSVADTGALLTVEGSETALLDPGEIALYAL